MIELLEKYAVIALLCIIGLAILIKILFWAILPEGGGFRVLFFSFFHFFSKPEIYDNGEETLADRRMQRFKIVSNNMNIIIWSLSVLLLIASMFGLNWKAIFFESQRPEFRK
jgi:hypothetical protein